MMMIIRENISICKYKSYYTGLYKWELFRSYTIDGQSSRILLAIYWGRIVEENINDENMCISSNFWMYHNNVCKLSEQFWKLALNFQKFVHNLKCLARIYDSWNTYLKLCQNWDLQVYILQSFSKSKVV